MEFSWLHMWPLWLSGVLLLSLFLVSIEVGLRSGLRIYRLDKEAREAAKGDILISALLGLLGLLLAFTYGFSLSRYDQRKDAIIAEINAIGTAFYRADLLPEPGRSDLRKALLDYARTRHVTAEMVRTRETIAQTLERSLAAQTELWPATRRALSEDVESPLAVAMITAINRVLDVHTQRTAAGFDTIPSVVLNLLVIVSAFALGVTTYNAALQGNSSRWRTMVFALVLTSLILIIVDFDMPLSGLIRSGTARMDTLIESLEGQLRP
jgi:hypothetical protein